MKCPECDYETDLPQQLGRHRRLAHGIPGKTAKYNRPSKHPRKREQCPECKAYFKGPQGRVTHMRKAHGLSSDGTPYTGPDQQLAKSLKRAKAVKQTREIVKAEIVTKHHRNKKNGVTHAPNHPELYAYVAAHLEALLRRVAFEHDLPERGFAQGFSAYLYRA